MWNRLWGTSAGARRKAEGGNGKNLTVSPVPDIPPLTARPSDFIDVREMLQNISVDELNRKAESYFRQITDPSYHLAKPFASVHETPELLICFAQVLMGLNLVPEMTVVDFGAGSCWASHRLSQLNMRVIAIDASSSALKIGERLYNEQPLFGTKPTPTFLPYDGHRIELSDGSVDRILCLDAFHHVPNPEEVLKEMGRILAPGGIAGFSEPGPNHSEQPQSQYEMRTFGVIENDIHLRQIWSWAQGAGFSGIRIAMFSAQPIHTSLDDFEAWLENDRSGDALKEHVNQEEKQYLQSHRLFFLQKGGAATPDSRQRAGLFCSLDVSLTQTSGRSGSTISARATIRNTGGVQWLPANASIGGVKLGVHLYDEKGVQINLDYFRQNLTPDPGHKIQVGETIEVSFDVPLPLIKGNYVLEFDLVSEGIAWFATNGSKAARFAVGSL